MITKFKLPFLLLSLLCLAISCNPDCESAANVNITMEPEAVLPGSQFLLRSVPANFLQERAVFIDDPGGTGEKLSIQARYAPELSGSVVTLPADADASSPIYVEDPDCRGDFIYVNDLQIEPEEFFFSSDLFVIPPMPIVVIPAPLPPPPVNITNAWITPYDRAYCIWFVPEYDDQLNEKKELRPHVPGIKMRTNLNPPNDFLLGSREFVVCGEDKLRPLVDVNPVSGIIDKENNFISIRIDRTSKGLGVEQLTGMFIDPSQLPDDQDWRYGGPCDGRNDPAGLFMLLTSSTTGQQMLMVKAFPKLQ